MGTAALRPVTVFLLLSLSLSILMLPFGSADREPNDNVVDSEKVEKSVNGVVDLEPFFDVDFYILMVSSEKSFRLKLTLVGEGMLMLYTTLDPNGTGFSTSLTIDGFSPSDEVKFESDEHQGTVHCFIQGKGNYVLEVLVPRDKVEVNGPSKELIIFISMGAFLLVFLILVSALFIKMVRMKREDNMDRALKTEIPYEGVNEQRCFRSDFETHESPYATPIRSGGSGELICYSLPLNENGKRLVTPVEDWSEEFEEDPY